MRWLIIHINLLLVALLFSSVKQAEACSCIPTHIQSHFCGADFVAVIKVKEAVLSNDQINPTLFRVKVRRVFKSPPATNLVLLDEIWTPPSSAACGVHLQLNSTFVVGGYIQSGKPWINLCGLVMPFERTSKSQRRGFRELYQLGCQCKVVYTPFDRKGSALEKANGTKCLWESEPGPMMCQGMYGICLKGHDGCSWFPSKSYKICIKEHQRIREQSRS